jgi:hypothetical protein
MTERTLFGFAEVGKRWNVSPWTVRRAADRGDLKAVYIGARRLIPLVEIERAEQFGIGKSRKADRGESRGR